MKEKVLFELTHIRLILSDSEQYCLIVEGTELNDYVEDFLWDVYQYQSTSVSMENKFAAVTYFNCFDASFPIEGLVEVLRKLDPNELERIFNRSN